MNKKVIARREVLGGVTVGLAALGVGALGLPAQARAAVPLPQGAMILSRRLERPLMDGQKIVVTRKWLVQFADHPQGISITGHQIDAQVDAPRQLAPLVELELNRSTDGMFPILLTPVGQIAATGSSESAEDVAAAVRTAESMIARQVNSPSQRVIASRALSQLQMAGGSLFDNMPPDLFFPRGQAVQNIQPVSLPDGLTGQFELNYDARPISAGTWLKQARRTVVTRLGDSSRSALEEWSLQPAE